MMSQLRGGTDEADMSSIEKLSLLDVLKDVNIWRREHRVFLLVTLSFYLVV